MEKHDHDSTVPVWRYAPGYERVMREGHLYPAPTCGSPSIIWHMAIAPKRRFGDKHELSEPWLNTKRIPWPSFLENAYNAYDKDYRNFIDQLNTLASRLQTQRVSAEDEFKLNPLSLDPDEGQQGPDTHQFLTAIPQTLSFTFWWPDPQSKAVELSPETSDSFIRVHVQIQTHTGYATITFIIDASKPYGKTQIETSPEDTTLTPEEKANATSIHADPQRRVRVRRALNIIRCSSLKQIRTGAVEEPRLPENEVCSNEARDLLEASEYIYKDIWEELTRDFNLDFLTSKNTSDELLLGERFCDLRGHVMSVSGLETQELDELQEEREDLKIRNAPTKGIEGTDHDTSSRKRTSFPDWRPGYGFDLREDERPHPVTGFDGFGRFHTFDSSRNEGHTLLRSLWPFIRRMSPWADYRELVGCGVMDWRALYVSTLGFGNLGFKFEDETPTRESDIPNNHLPVLEHLWRRDKDDNLTDKIKELNDYREGSKPARFLIITKGEPHREQLGRFIERITALETGRIFALRDIVMIRNAGTHLELIGRMLDGLLEHWSNKREEVEEKWRKTKLRLIARRRRRERLRRPLRYISSYFDAKVPELPIRMDKEWAIEEQKYIDELNEHIKDTDRHAIRLAAALDGRIGARGAGRIHYAIRRSNLAIQEFDRLVDTLRVGNIEGWTSYPQFVTRGLKPSFDFIKTTGTSLVAMRTRLQTITETIQTAALIAETEATRLNTQTLQEVARFFAHTRWIVLTGFLLITGVIIELTAAENLKPLKIIQNLFQTALPNLMKYLGFS